MHWMKGFNSRFEMLNNLKRGSASLSCNTIIITRTGKKYPTCDTASAICLCHGSRGGNICHLSIIFVQIEILSHLLYRRSWSPDNAS